jgi:hypothetical protein
MNCSILIFVMIFFINIYILYYLNKLIKSDNKCLSKKRILDIANNSIIITYTRYYTIITIAITSLIILYYIVKNILNFSYDMQFYRLKTLYLIYSTLGFISIYILNRLSYNILISECDDNIKKTNKYIYYYSSLIINGYVLVVAFSLFMSFCYKDLKILNFVSK